VHESGHASEGEVFALAGLGGTSRQWMGFADEWNAVMYSGGLTEPFHAVEFEGAWKQFEHFRERRDEWRAMHDALTDVILRHKLTMMSAVVPLPVWRQMDAESRRTNDPYFLATEAIVSDVARDGELTTGGELDLAFYFEKPRRSGCSTRSAPTRWSSSASGSYRSSLVANRGRRLQAADLVAYEVRKRVLAILADDMATGAYRRFGGAASATNARVDHLAFGADRDNSQLAKRVASR